MAKTVRGSVLIWSGPSQFDRAVPIGAFLTLRKSKNSKTGALPQVTILRLDIHPNSAIKSAGDYAICRNCKLRGTRGRIAPKRARHRRSCYVQVNKGPAAIWKSYRRGNVPTWTIDQANAELQARALQALQAGSRADLRLTAYGDPAAVPVAVWQALSAGLRTVGYTHQWRTAGLQALTMASCDTAVEREQARALGYRTFRVSEIDGLPMDNEILCPASEQARKRTECFRCGLCNGHPINRPNVTRDIMIPAHGPLRKYFPLTVTA